MATITFMGAGSSVFAKNVLGDCLLLDSLKDADIRLYDIDAQRLEDSQRMVSAINNTVNQGRARISSHLGRDQRQAALAGADYVVNAIQVGGYEPCTVTDFEVPKKYGLRQTIADTLGIGGIFRTLRTLPVMLDFAREMEAVCPDAWLLNYTNPMAMLAGGVLEATDIQTVGLCHSVQGCAQGLLRMVGMSDEVSDLRWEVAGINHQAWLLSLHDGERDIYPQVRERARAAVDEVRRRGIEQVKAERQEILDSTESWDVRNQKLEPPHRVVHDLVRLEFLFRLGHYVTESSEHNSEYCPWFIKSSRPELIEAFNIPLDEYPRRCRSQIDGWAKRREELLANAELGHEGTNEFGAYIMDAIETDRPYRIHGNLLNRGLITNLPRRACVEVACLVDRNGVQPTVVGDLPEACAALNRSNVNVQLLTIDAVLKGSKDCVYQAAMMDPHTASELAIDHIVALCDDLIEAHGDWLPRLS